MIGTTAGNYRIDAKLGAGGMGAVYLAEHLLIGRKSAVKVLLPQYSHNPELVSRFFNEARSTALIKHPGLVDVYDFGFLPDGSAYLVMEYLEGQSLSALLENDAPVHLPMVWSVGRQVASAVHAAHEKGIVHRDLKPDNIFLVPDVEQPEGVRVKVLDFGIAKLSGDGTATTAAKTRTGAVMGTPAYMSPEQCKGSGQVDRRTDVYSLGCILFEMACGQPPFDKEGAGELIAAHIYETPPLPSSIEPSISPVLEGLIVAMIAKDPGARPPTMGHVKDALDHMVSELGMRLTPAMGSSPGAFATGPHIAMQTELQGEAQDGQGSHKGRYVALAVLVLLLVAGTTLFVVKPWASEKPKRTDSPSSQASTEPREQPVERPRELPRVAVPAKVALRVLSEPSGAEVYRAVDGVLLGPTPYAQEAAPSAGRAVFIVKLAGHKDARVELPADRPGEITATLSKLATPSRGAATPPVTPPARGMTAPPRLEPDRPPAMRPIRDGVVDPFGG